MILSASVEGRGIFPCPDRRCRSVFIPLTVGGSINTLEDFDRVLKCGADKVSVNSGAIKNQRLIEDAAKRYGDQCVVLSMDVKAYPKGFELFTAGGRKATGIDAVLWARQGETLGAGEIVLNSIDTDGVKKGFDIEMLSVFADAVKIPIIASGGAGRMEDFKVLLNR